MTKISSKKLVEFSQLTESVAYLFKMVDASKPDFLPYGTVDWDAAQDALSHQLELGIKKLRDEYGVELDLSEEA